jgi:hypothetical protein
MSSHFSLQEIAKLMFIRRQNRCPQPARTSGGKCCYGHSGNSENDAILENGIDPETGHTLESDSDLFAATHDRGCERCFVCVAGRAGAVGKERPSNAYRTRRWVEDRQGVGRVTQRFGFSVNRERSTRNRFFPWSAVKLGRISAPEFTEGS